jgi:hypothetical protein
VPGELMWLAVALFGSVGLIVVLGTRSTARYEFERNGVQRQPRTAPAPAGVPAAAPSGGVAAGEQSLATRPAPGSAAPGVATHPAGRMTALAPMATGWWLVDGPGAPLAGPFSDAVDADWAAFSLGVPETARVVFGAQRQDGGVLRRPSPHERAWLQELGRQLDRLPEEWTELIDDEDPSTSLAVDVTAALLEAGLPLHDRDDEAGSASGGACLTPHPASGGLVVAWRQHDRMTVQQVRGDDVRDAVQRTMTAAVTGVLHQLGFTVEPYGSTGAHLVTGSGR